MLARFDSDAAFAHPKMRVRAVGVEVARERAPNQDLTLWIA